MEKEGEETVEEEKRWQAAKATYLRGNVGYRALAEIYGLPLSRLAKRARAENWVELRSRCAAAGGMAQSPEASAGTTPPEDGQIEACRRKIALAADRLLDAIVEGIESGAFTDSTRAIREIGTTLKNIKDAQGIRSAADLREQEARIKKLEEEARHDDGGAAVTVTFTGDTETYAG